LIHQETFPKDDSVHITDAFSFFKEVRSNSSPFLHKKVAVYGGGKLALYLARMIKRFGSEVSVYFPGDKKLMPAYDYETTDALEEGVDVQLLKSINKIEKKKITWEKMKIEKGKAVGTGEWEDSPADVLILANRQETDSGFLRAVPAFSINDDGTIAINAERMTGQDGIFAGGDMLPGENRSATIAIGQGKKAARYIDSYLKKKDIY
jgi:Thioredoxin reductase